MSPAPFKGNVDLEKLEELLKGPETDKIPFVLMTITNNTGGGQPVSMDNLKKVKELCTKYNKMFLLDHVDLLKMLGLSPNEKKSIKMLR